MKRQTKIAFFSRGAHGYPDKSGYQNIRLIIRQYG